MYDVLLIESECTVGDHKGTVMVLKSGQHYDSIVDRAYCNNFIPTTIDDVPSQSINTYSSLNKALHKNQGMKIGCLNVRGLLGKIDEIKLILTECKFDIMGVCETFMDCNISDKEISVQGYSFVKKNRTRHGGGVLLYVKHDIDYNELTGLTGGDVESVWIKVRHRNESLALGVMYRPPASKNNYFNNILDQLDNVFSLNEKIVLIGDLNFNYKFDETLSCNPLHQIEILYNMRQLITVPTRVTLNTSTLIDVIFSNDYQSHGETGVYETAVSDHYLIYTVYCKINATKLGTHKVTKFRNYNKFSAAVFKKELLANDCVTDVDWHAHMLPGKWQAFKNAFIAASDKCAPFQMRRLKNRNNPWVDDNLVKLMYKRDHLKRKAIKLKDESLWLLYKQTRNCITNSIHDFLEVT